MPAMPRICPSMRRSRASNAGLVAVYPRVDVVGALIGSVSIPIPPTGIGWSRDDDRAPPMSALLAVLWHGLRDALLMAWEVWWALVLGFAISAIVQAWVPRRRIEQALSGSGPRPIALAGALGAASSSCSYAAVAIGKSLFQKGASAASTLAFQFASTNLVWELGVVLWVLIGWQFAVAEYVGGIVMIVLMAAG